MNWQRIKLFFKTALEIKKGPHCIDLHKRWTNFLIAVSKAPICRHKFCYVAPSKLSSKWKFSAIVRFCILEFAEWRQPVNRRLLRYVANSTVRCRLRSTTVMRKNHYLEFAGNRSGLCTSRIADYELILTPQVPPAMTPVTRHAQFDDD